MGRLDRALDPALQEATDTLLISPGFFGYAREMQRVLEARCRRVAVLNDSAAVGGAGKAAIRLAPGLTTSWGDSYFAGIAMKYRTSPIRDVLVIKGEGLSPAATRNLRATFPQARFTLYFWDSYRNMPPDSREKVALFDRSLSFDPHDAQADPRLVYRPLFFIERYAQLPDRAQDIDLLFFGTVHGDRYAVLKRIERAVPAGTRFEKVLYFRARWLYFLNRLADPALWPARRGEFIFKPRSREEIAELTARARIVVDIERPIQTGFTIRTIEMLGAGRKLISTNAELAKADFYDPANIAVVDRRAPRIAEEFLRAPYSPLPQELVRRYSLNGWMDDVMPHIR